MLSSLCLICSLNIHPPVCSMLQTMIADRKFTRFTVHFIEHVRMSLTYFLCWNVFVFITVCHNIVIYCFEIFYMVFFTLGTHGTWTRLTVVFCVSLTLVSLKYCIWEAYCLHIVDDLFLKFKTCVTKNKID